MSVFLTGKLCELSGLLKNPARAKKMASWANDPDVNALLFTGTFPENAESILETWTEDVDGDDSVVFAITVPLWKHKAAGRVFVGTAGLYQIDGVHRTAEFRTFIGHKGWWGQGIGTEATQLIVGYGFDKLHMHCIWLGVNAGHTAAIRVYEKVGFQHEGRLREQFWRGGDYYDILRLSILEDEWYTKQQS